MNKPAAFVLVAGVTLMLASPTLDNFLGRWEGGGVRVVYADRLANGLPTVCTYTKVTFPIEEYDKTANYDTANSRFTPNVAGVYSITASIGLDTSVDTTRAILAIYKNGANYKKLFDITASMPRAIAGSANVYLNGTTDYIEVWTWVAATTASVDGSVASSFQSVLVVPD